MPELKRIKAELCARGVKSVSIAWSPNAGAVPFQKRAEDVVKFFDAVLAGRYRPAPPIGDSVR